MLQLTEGSAVSQIHQSKRAGAQQSNPRSGFGRARTTVFVSELLRLRRGTNGQTAQLVFCHGEINGHWTRRVVARLSRMLRNSTRWAATRNSVRDCTCTTIPWPGFVRRRRTSYLTARSLEDVYEHGGNLFGELLR